MMFDGLLTYRCIDLLSHIDICMSYDKTFCMNLYWHFTK